MRLTLHHFELATRHPFTIARGTRTSQRTLIVELEEEGVRGYGEAGESNFYGATLENMTAAVEAARPIIERQSLRQNEPAELWQFLITERPELKANSFALSAIDIAEHDLWGKLRGAPLWKLWGLDLDRCPPSDYTIGIDTVATMLAKLREFPGFPVYKIKLGGGRDLETLQALRRETDARFRVDANCAWTAAEAIETSFVLLELGVEFIEQPLPREEWAAMERVYRESALPVIADESCRTEEDVARCAGVFHGVNVKLSKCGGLTPARRMLAHARELGLKTMIGCFTECSVGISAAAQLLPLTDYADLDGALLLAEDPAAGVMIDRGRVVFPQENGCGARLLRT